MHKKDHIKKAAIELKNTTIPDDCSHVVMCISPTDSAVAINQYTFALRGFSRSCYIEICDIEEFTSYSKKEFDYLDSDNNLCRIVSKIDDNAWVEYQKPGVKDAIVYTSTLSLVQPVLTPYEFSKEVIKLYNSSCTPEQLGLSVAKLIQKNRLDV
ncbi:hypothetical protein vBAmePPT11V19_00079 [Alteromonas phage vB_AmeP_PT11-V19]|nr:hypothetical protein vBAmePPT11V19_00079 [Alteromonas phage vB_AmeP_PT11-V19]